MKKNITLALDILKNWSSYHLGFPAPIPVGYVIISMTYACNAKCVMCNLHNFYSERPDLYGKEIELENLFNALKHSSIIRTIRHIDLTGGEPFVRKNLQDFIRLLFGLPVVDLVTINTNGILSKKIVDDVKSILSVLKSHQRFSLSISIDGIGSLHDTIRGVPGIVEKVEKTIELLSKLREKHPQFSLRSNAVVQPLNLRVLNSIQTYWKKHGIAGSFSVIQTPFYTHTNEQNTYNDIRMFNKQELSLIKSAIPKSRGMNYYLDKGCTRPLHCFAGYSAMCIDPFGTIYPCNFLTGNEVYAMGDIRNSGIDAAWASQQARAVRKKVKTCPYTHCWNGCEVDQTLVQFDAFDKTIQAVSGGLLSYYRLRGVGDMK
jgi:radical SAM protein with 4Fe4S-binding SPASM domain